MFDCGLLFGCPCAGYSWVLEPHGMRGEMYYIPQISCLPQEHHPSQWVGDRSIDFIRENSDSERPWYLFSGFIHPHPPLAPPNPWQKLYRAPLMPLPNVPADWESLLTHINRRQNRFKYRDQGIDRNLVRSMKAHYYACVSFIDFQVFIVFIQQQVEIQIFRILPCDSLRCRGLVVFKIQIGKIQFIADLISP